MADSSNPFGTIAIGQGDQATKANALFDAASPAALYGMNISTTTGLTWGYLGGHPTLLDGSLGTISSATIAVTASSTNYLVAKKSDGSVSVATSSTNWDNRVEYWRLYSLVAGAASITSYTDAREIGKMTATAPFDMAVFYPGVPAESAIVGQLVAARALYFAGNLSGSAGFAKTAATASTVFDVKKNGSSVGSITFAISGTVPTFTTTAGAALILAVGDRLEIVAPASPDATLADVSFTLAGSR